MRVQTVINAGVPRKRMSRFTAYILFLLLCFTGSHQRVAEMTWFDKI